MSCTDEMKTLLSRYVDGELAKEEQLKIEEHLLACEPCRELLALFQKNESLLSNALSTEAFGNAVIESVIRTIKKEPPPEAEPVKESFGDWVRSRPWLQLAAAVLLAAGLLAILNASQNKEMEELRADFRKHQELVEKAREDSRQVAAALQDQYRVTCDLSQELGRQLRDRASTEVFRAAREGTTVAYEEPVERYLVVKAVFNPKAFSGYNIFRKKEGEKDDKYERLNKKEPIKTPEFMDRTAKAGQPYIYKFQAMRRDGSSLESAPQLTLLHFAGDLSPEQSVLIHCEELAAPKDNAVFSLERVVNGKRVSDRFYVRLNERVGGLRDVPGVGRVDFTTDLVLERIDEGTEPLTITYTTPVLDPDGNPITDSMVGDTVIPRTRQGELVIGTRPSMRGILRVVGTTDEKSVLSLWKDSWMRVKAH